MKNKNYYGVIMAGGVGSRFWPLSKKKLPKQFIDIFNTGKTLFQEAYERLLNHCPAENIYVVTNEAYRSIINEQIPDLGSDQILGEPHPRNTAPCIAYAAFKIHAKNPDAVMAVVPSDHLIMEPENFDAVMEKAYHFASQNDYLLTLGIKPSRPDTGYGYIQMDEENNIDGIYKVKTFTEKPNNDLAKYFYESGEFFWNSGMFVWSSKAILDAYKKLLPEMHETFQKGENQFYTKDEQSFINKAYEMCTIISIDYGIMEKAHNVYVMPSSFQWSDIGTWTALYEYAQKDANKNVIKGDSVFVRNTTNCIVNVPDKKLVALNSVNNLIVVETDGILLIADKDKEQEIRMVVNDIKSKFGEKYI